MLSFDREVSELLGYDIDMIGLDPGGNVIYEYISSKVSQIVYLPGPSKRGEPCHEDPKGREWNERVIGTPYRLLGKVNVAQHMANVRPIKLQYWVFSYVFLCETSSQTDHIPQLRDSRGAT